MVSGPRNEATAKTLGKGEGLSGCTGMSLYFLVTLLSQLKLIGKEKAVISC